MICIMSQYNNVTSLLLMLTIYSFNSRKMLDSQCYMHIHLSPQNHKPFLKVKILTLPFWDVYKPAVQTTGCLCASLALIQTEHHCLGNARFSTHPRTIPTVSCEELFRVTVCFLNSKFYLSTVVFRKFPSVKSTRYSRTSPFFFFF